MYALLLSAVLLQAGPPGNQPGNPGDDPSWEPEDPEICDPNPTDWFGTPVAGTADSGRCDAARNDPMLPQSWIPSGGDKEFDYYQGEAEHCPHDDWQCGVNGPGPCKGAPFERGPGGPNFEWFFSAEAPAAGKAGPDVFTPGQSDHPKWKKKTPLPKVGPVPVEVTCTMSEGGPCICEQGVYSYEHWKVRVRMIRRHVLQVVNGVEVWQRCGGCGDDAALAKLFVRQGFHFTQPRPLRPSPHWSTKEPDKADWCP